MIIGLSGLAGSGKDTVGDFLVQDHGFVKVALADEIKRTAQRWYDFTDSQLWGPSEMRNAPDKRYPKGPDEYLTPRYVLQFLGTEAGRQFYDNTWVDITLRAARLILGPIYNHAAYSQKHGVQMCGCWNDDRHSTHPPGWKNPLQGVVIPDVRFKNEIKAIREAGGKLVRIVRRGAGLQGAGAQHRSETEQTEIPDSEFDHIITNYDTLEWLRQLVERMMIRLS